MTKKTVTRRRLIENEVIFREANRAAHEFVEEQAETSLPLPFYCECSRADCREQIKLSIKQYKLLHGYEKLFTVRPGHANPALEDVVKKQSRVWVVQKRDPLPKPSQLNKAVATLNI